jgi:hypothetical protein
MKKCRLCLKELPLENFYFNKKKNRYIARCRKCVNERINTSPATLARKEKTKKYRKEHFLNKNYSLSSEEYNNILKRQNNKCAICGKEETAKAYGETIALSVDHDHKHNNIRGLLCKKHNMGLGYFQDSPELLQAAITYLQGQEKVKVMRYSGLPVDLQNMKAYQEEWEREFDRLKDLHTPDMLSLQSALATLENELKVKWKLIEEWPYLNNIAAIKKKIEEYQCPIMVAKSADNPEEIVYVLVDQIIG